MSSSASVMTSSSATFWYCAQRGSDREQAVGRPWPACATRVRAVHARLLQRGSRAGNSRSRLVEQDRRGFKQIQPVPIGFKRPQKSASDAHRWYPLSLPIEP
eukprot:626651-Alexandrium_andersonii.AAC.1